MARKVFNFDNVTDGSAFNTPTAAAGTSAGFTGVSGTAPVRDNSVKPSGAAGAGRVTLASSGTGFIYDDMTTDSGALRFMFNLLGTGMPTVDCGLLWVGVGTTRVVSVGYLGSTNKLRLYDAANGNAWTSTTSVPDGVFGVDFYFAKGTSSTDGKLRCDLLDASGAVLQSSGMLTTANVGTASLTRWRAGITTTSSLTSGLMLAAGQSESAATNVLGPPAAVPPSLVVGGAKRYTIDAASGTSGGTAPLTYAISQTDGTTTTPVLESTGRWSVVQDTAGPLTYSVTVTDANNLSQTQAVTVPAQSTGTSGGVRELVKISGTFQ